MFLDQARISIKAGDGGSGCMAFRREKYVPREDPVVETVGEADMCASNQPFGIIR